MEHKKEVASFFSVDDHADALKEFNENVMPNLEADFRTNYKGKAGKKIGVIGGDRKYAGAPYFAAMAACKAGADIVHVFCHEEAAKAIKSYSPDLIVHACLKDSRDAPDPSDDDDDDDDVKQEGVRKFLEENWEMIARMDAIVVGPGLGRDWYTWLLVCAAVNVASIRCVPMVFDADALYMIGTFFNGRDALPKETKDMRDMIDTWRNVGQMSFNLGPPRLSNVPANGFIVFTPNVREFTYGFNPEKPEVAKVTVDNFLGTNYELRVNYPSILAKGADDIFVHLEGAEGPIKFENVPGSKKRCGGQGDILSGVLAVFLAWSRDKHVRDSSTSSNTQPGTRADRPKAEEDSSSSFRESSKLACFCASKLTREGARRAYEKHKRSVQSSDILVELPGALEDLFPSSSSSS